MQKGSWGCYLEVTFYKVVQKTLPLCLEIDIREGCKNIFSKKVQ